MNFLFAKLNHHLLGFPSPPSGNTLASSRTASSWRTCDMYWRRVSASWRSRGGSYIYILWWAGVGQRLRTLETDGTDLIQGPRRVAGNGKVEIERQVHDILGRLPNALVGLDLAEAVADEPDAVDEQAVGRAADLKVAEEGVGSEQRQHFVQDVVAGRVRVGRLGGRRQRRIRERKRVCRAARLRPERQQWEVADQPRRVWVLVEDGIVSLLGRVFRARLLAAGQATWAPPTPGAGGRGGTVQCAAPGHRRKAYRHCEQSYLANERAEEEEDPKLERCRQSRLIPSGASS